MKCKDIDFFENMLVLSIKKAGKNILPAFKYVC